MISVKRASSSGETATRGNEPLRSRGQSIWGRREELTWRAHGGVGCSAAMGSAVSDTRRQVTIGDGEGGAAAREVLVTRSRAGCEEDASQHSRQQAGAMSGSEMQSVRREDCATGWWEGAFPVPVSVTVEAYVYVEASKLDAANGGRGRKRCRVRYRAAERPLGD